MFYKTILLMVVYLTYIFYSISPTPVESNGQSVQLSVRLGELMSSQKLFPFMYRGTVSDFNSATEPGYYNVSGTSDIPHQPDGAYRYGTLLVYGNDFITQIYISDSYNILYIRDFYVTWRSWKKYSPTT